MYSTRTSSNIKKLYILPRQCSYVHNMALRINSNCILRHTLVNLLAFVMKKHGSLWSTAPHKCISSFKEIKEKLHIPNKLRPISNNNFVNEIYARVYQTWTHKLHETILINLIYFSINFRGEMAWNQQCIWKQFPFLIVTRES